MTNSQALRVVSAYADAWMAGDLETVLGLYHPDLVLIWPGDHALAGEHRALDASLTALAALQEATGRQPITIHSIVEEAGVVVLDVTERWIDAAGEPTLVRRELHHTVADGQLHTCRVVEADALAVDAWLAAATPGASAS